MPDYKDGWGNPRPNSPNSKFHYFVDHDSLCGKWGFYFGETEQGRDDHHENCKACQKEKQKRDKPSVKPFPGRI